MYSPCPRLYITLAVVTNSTDPLTLLPGMLPSDHYDMAVLVLTNDTWQGKEKQLTVSCSAAEETSEQATSYG